MSVDLPAFGIPDQADAGDQFELELHLAHLAIGARGANVRSLMSRGFEAVIALSPFSALADQKFLVEVGEIKEHLSGRHRL